MRRRWPAAMALGVAAAAIVGYKQWFRAPIPIPNRAARIAKSGTNLSLLLVADPREANESDGCGQIIRVVRAAGARGIPLREVSPSADSEIDSRYRILVSPTVLVLKDGKVLKRYEGESPETVKAVHAELEVLEDHR